ncbi:hypothetical protein WJX73_009860 [Symbiochloris irregularis]|uniref:Uncharacterized protein n=1 Tax=Symbiochloris irregularis TaxID=706552 RepID=A0AAW1NYM9_9CHLO
MSLLFPTTEEAFAAAGCSSTSSAFKLLDSTGKAWAMTASARRYSGNGKPSRENRYLDEPTMRKRTDEPTTRAPPNN